MRTTRQWHATTDSRKFFYQAVCSQLGMSYPWKADMGADIAARRPSANKRRRSGVLSNPPAAVQRKVIGYDCSLWNAVLEHVTVAQKQAPHGLLCSRARSR
jgi:hypothetical protein